MATLTYGHETDKDNNIYYRILKTAYGEAGDPSSVTGLNTDALNVLFHVDMMDSCEEMMIQDWYGALYKKDDTAFELRKQAGLSSATFTRLRKNEEVTLSVILKIADVLDCNAGDMMDFVKEEASSRNEETR